MLLNGLFGVFHPKGQRAIFDCRPANSGEVRLPGTRLPNGPMLARLRIPRGFGLRGSGDDLENFFYQLTEAESMIPRRAFGSRSRELQRASWAWTRVHDTACASGSLEWGPPTPRTSPKRYTSMF